MKMMQSAPQITWISCSYENIIQDVIHKSDAGGVKVGLKKIMR